MLKKLTLVVGACLLFSSASHAQQLGNIFWESEVVPAPLDGISIDYRVFGSSPVAQQEIEFFLSSDQNPNTGVSLGTRRINFNCSPGRFCSPPFGEQNFFVRSFNLPEPARSIITDIQNACTPQGPFFAVGRIIASRSVSLNSATFGTTKPTDLLFDSGSFSPANLPNTGVANVQYSLRATCGGAQAADVGIFIADDQFNILGLVGTLPSPGPFGGTQSFNLNFAAFGLPAGNYNLVLFADINQEVGESDEDNNIGTFAFTLTDSFAPPEETLNSKPIEFLDRTPLLGPDALQFDEQGLEFMDGLLDGVEEPKPYE